MTLFKLLFVLLLCVPVAYVALRLIVSLIDNIVESRRGGGRTS